MGQAVLLHEDGRFFTANAAGAKADDGFVLQFFFVRPKGIWKLRELGQAPVDGALEGAFVHFVIVAGVQNDHRAAVVVKPLVEPALGRGGGDGRGAALDGSNGGVVHANDLAFDLHQHLLKWNGLRPAFFRGDV